ncbi:MAG: hypothetical protein MK085_03765 [Phycisphaerales bacterium]|nr:hypothetical protein [Phycisphaerales bacterium]
MPARCLVVSSLFVAAASWSLVGCGESSAPAPKPPSPVVKEPVQADSPESSEPAGSESNSQSWRVSTASDDPRVAEVAGMAFPKPTTWAWQPVTNSFRTLQYEVPAVVAGDNSATLVFSEFIGTDGGPTDLNIQRWVGQFSSEDGSAVEPVLGSMEGDGFTIEMVETVGSYRGMGAAAPSKGQRQLGAIVEAPGRRIFIRLVGPDSTVDAARVDFQKLIAGARLTDSDTENNEGGSQ